MTHSAIAASTVVFNMLTALAAAFFAVCGALSLVCPKSPLNIFRGRAFARAFCVAALLAFALEATVFNIPYYLRYFSGGEIHTLSLLPEEADSAAVRTSDGTPAEFIYRKERAAAVYPNGPVDNAGGYRWARAPGDSVKVLEGVAFRGVNRRVTSIFVQPQFGAAEEQVSVVFEYTDEKRSGAGFRALYRDYPAEYCIPVQPFGGVSELRVKWSGKVSRIEVNRPVPMRFSGLRLLAVSCLVFAAVSLARKKLRAGIARFLFEYRFDPSSRAQNRVYALAVALLVLFSGACAFTSTSDFWQNGYVSDRQYSHFLVDAVIGGRAYLDHGMPEMMLLAERPYDLDWLNANGFRNGVYWMSDWAYYKGKLYCYFGVVPALVLYVPYKLVTGEYLSNNAGIFLFVAAAVVLMAALWRFLVKKYMPDTLFAFYLLSFLALFFASGLFVPLRFTRFYSIVSAAAFMFVVAGVFLLLKSVERGKPNCFMVSSACLCLALAVGCRPNMAVVSLVVPAVLWRHRSLRLAAFAIVPYIMVAVPLCMYNYARFGSVFEFGLSYNMTTVDTTAHALLNPFGRPANALVSALSYLFSVNGYSIFFPFVETVPQHAKRAASIVMFYDKGSGMVNFPIVFCLFFYFRSVFAAVKPRAFYLSSAFLAVAAAMIFADSWLIGHSGRYQLDFAFFMLVPSVFFAWRWCAMGGVEGGGRFRLKAAYAMLAASVFVGLFLFAGQVSNDPSPGNPVLYRYLQASFGVPGAF